MSKVVKEYHKNPICNIVNKLDVSPTTGYDWFSTLRRAG
jgi:hypothetical protein